MLAFGLVAAVLLGMSIWHYRHLQDELAALTLRTAAIDRPKQSSRLLSKGEQEALVLRVKDANAVLAELGVDWNGLLDGLERAASPDAVLLEVRPDVLKGQLRLAGEARNLPELLKYVRRLEAHAPLTDVALEEHETAHDDPQKPVRFVINAHWRQTP
jgi:hypothetical protein